MPSAAQLSHLAVGPHGDVEPVLRKACGLRCGWEERCNRQISLDPSSARSHSADSRSPRVTPSPANPALPSTNRSRARKGAVPKLDSARLPSPNANSPKAALTGIRIRLCLTRAGHFTGRPPVRAPVLLTQSATACRRVRMKRRVPRPCPPCAFANCQSLAVLFGTDARQNGT